MSLDKLFSFPPVEDFAILDNHFSASHTTEKIKLLHRKFFTPIHLQIVLKSSTKPNYPPFDQWVDTLRGGRVSITDKYLSHSNEVIKKLAESLGDYTYLYLKRDPLFLAAVFEQFRKVFYRDLRCTDCVQVYSASNLAGDFAPKFVERVSTC